MSPEMFQSFVRGLTSGHKFLHLSYIRTPAALRFAIASLALLFALVWGARPARAIVNTEPLFSDVSRDRPYSLVAQAGLDIQRGNTQLLVFTAGLASRAQYLEHEFLLSGAHERSNASDEQIGNKSFAHLRYRYWIHERVQWEFFGQLAQDRFRLIRLRGLGGTGPRFVPLQSEIFEWSLGLSYFYEVEDVEGSVDFPNGKTRKTHRANLLSRMRLDYKKLTLRQVIYAQPAFANPSNIRVMHELDFAVEVFNHFSLTWTLVQTRDSIAPSDVVPFDNRLQAGIKVDL